MKKTTQLKNLIQSNELAFLMEAHSGLSAKIVERAGFAGIWGSGLSISAAMGVRDCNEASWTQVLETAEFMADATSIPILLDADTGFGNFNNVRRLVRKLEQRGVAGMCIEDKLFPKSNSFAAGPQPLATIEEFVGKIQAAKDTQVDEDFCVVARVEAFIAGYGLDEAMRRAEAYYAAGADAILMHSKRDIPSDVLDFIEVWDDRCPVIIVPTTYYTTPTSVFEDAGFSMVIWANHLMRASHSAMQAAADQIFAETSVESLVPNIGSVKEVFEMQGLPELKSAEKHYLPAPERAPALS